MQKLLLSVTVLLFLFSCSNEKSNDHTKNESVVSEGVDENASETLSFEEQIQKVIKANSYNPEDIVDYDLKQDYIYVFLYNPTNGLSPAILKNEKDKLVWIKSWDAIQTSSLSAGDAPIVTIVQPEDADVKDVKIFGKSARMTKFTIEITEDFSKEVKYWVYYSKQPDEVLDNITEDIEYMK